MREHLWGLITEKPNRENARKMDLICCAEGGCGFDELNVTEGSTPGLNHGHYVGWFWSMDHGGPRNQQVAARVAERIASEVTTNHDQRTKNVDG